MGSKAKTGNKRRALSLLGPQQGIAKVAKIMALALKLNVPMFQTEIAAF